MNRVINKYNIKKLFCRTFVKKNLPINIGFKKLQFLTQHSHAISYNRVIGFRFLESCLLLSQPKTTVKEKVICVRGGVVKFWIVWNKMNISPALMKDVLCIVTSMGLRYQTSNLWIPHSDALPLGTQNVFFVSRSWQDEQHLSLFLY